jgi:hypothetical protein
MMLPRHNMGTIKPFVQGLSLLSNLGFLPLEFAAEGAGAFEEGRAYDQLETWAEARPECNLMPFIAVFDDEG